jgi:hypothetical protein
MHALSSTSSKAKTFPLFVTIGNLKFLSLIDSGSIATFMDPSVIMKTDITVQNHSPIKVNIANGNIVWTQGVTPNCPYTIQGHHFISDFRTLELEGYDLILGCDWIFEFSLVGINLKTRGFTMERDGQRICFKDETLPNEKFLVSHKKMKKILQKGEVGAVIYVHKLQLHDSD